ncbi:periphilin-1 [Solea solea]|uniref:periphilin-1 n=1 Tax=Solea solea TaxID=90069 RepID=UPI00272B9CF7|nr:periphilin-1 [Solea solea]
MYCLEENTVVFEEHKPQTGRDTDHVWPKDALQNKASATRHSNESVDLILSDVSMSPDQDEKRPIRRVRSPSRPRARGSSSYKPKFEGHFYKQCYTKNEHPSYKPGSGSQRYHHSSSRAFLDRRHHLHPKPHHSVLRDREREKEKKWQEWREIPDEISPQKKDNTTRPLPRSNSSRDKDMQFTNDWNRNREQDHRGSKGKEGEQSREREPPLTVSQAATTRGRAIKKRRRELDEMYYQECEMFVVVTKMLIEKDPSLERPIQSALQENLRDIGKRCVEAMEKFIDRYDSLH